MKREGTVVFDAEVTIFCRKIMSGVREERKEKGQGHFEIFEDISFEYNQKKFPAVKVG